MAAETSAHASAVDWSGENPGMYLKEKPDGPFVTLAFRVATALRSMRYVEATLSWENLGAPFMIRLPAAQSATGRHELWSLFVDARRVSARVNGRDLRGHPVPRDFAGRRSSSAFLAFSETWIRA